MGRLVGEEGDGDGAAVILGDATRSRERRGVGEGEDWEWVRRERREDEVMMSWGLDRREGGVESIDEILMCLELRGVVIF